MTRPVVHTNEFINFFREEPLWAFLVVGVICLAAEIAAIIFLHHPIEINF